MKGRIEAFMCRSGEIEEDIESFDDEGVEDELRHYVEEVDFEKHPGEYMTVSVIDGCVIVDFSGVTLECPLNRTRFDLQFKSE